MKVARFECIGGASGDMILGALLDAGLPLQELRSGLEKLGVEGFDLRAERVDRCGIQATRVAVQTEDQAEHRHLNEIETIIDAAALPGEVSSRAKKAFAAIAEAEARIHGTTADKIHFHEVGGLDTIVDVVGAMLAVSLLGIDRVIVTPFRLGQGIMQIEHGTFPIPAPATTEILRNWPVEFTNIPYELTTPTGAAVLTTLAVSAESSASFHIDRIGYGAGSRDLVQLPNVLRVVVGDETGGLEIEGVFLVEANIDDMNPEIYPYLMENLLKRGAQDVFLTPVVMKKGRPGTTLSVLVPAGYEDTVIRFIFEETTTIGVRMHRVERQTLPRRIVEVTSSLGRLKVKEVRTGKQRRYVPEYEECRRLAAENHKPLREVYALLDAELRRLS